MAVLDFLFQGSPPPQTTQYGSTSTSVPDWWAAYTQGLIGKANAIAAEPYQPYPGQRIADVAPETQSAWTIAADNTGQWEPLTTQGSSMIQGSALGPGALGAAQPMLDQAGQTIGGNANATTYGNIDNYMNPYTSAVTDRIAELGARNLTENLLPGVNDTFTKAGQFGSSRHGDFTGRAVRDTNESILGAQSQALERGYTQAGQQAQADLQRQLSAGQSMGALGATSGNLASSDLSRMLSAGQSMGALGQTIQNLGQQDAAALEAIGASKEGREQKNLDTAYNDFLQQRDYPRDNIRFLNEAIRGMAPPSTQTNTSQTGPANTYQPSPLAAVAGLGTSAYALQNLFKARGGRVKRRA